MFVVRLCFELYSNGKYCNVKFITKIKHHRQILASNGMHIPYWLSILPAPIVFDLMLFYRGSLNAVYNKHQIINRLRKLCLENREFLIKYGLLKLSTLEHKDSDEESVSNVNPLSPQSMRQRVNKMVDLLMTQDAKISIGQQFLNKVMACLFKKNPQIEQNLRVKMTPLIIRDVNASIKAHRNDPMRVIREAFSNKHINLSHNKALATRKQVC